MKALIDYIGVLGCGTVVPASGIYINELPGITLKGIDSIANSEQVTWLSVWSDIQKRAARRFENSVQKLFAVRYKIEKLKLNHCLNNSDYSVDLINFNDPFWRGFSIKIEPCNGSQSPMQSIFISTLRLYNSIHESTTIAVFDMATGDRLFEKTINTDAEVWTIIDVNQEFYSPWIFIAYDSSTVSSYDLEIAESDSINACPCLTTPTFNVIVSGQESYDLESPTIVEAGTNSFGLTGCFSILCSFSNIVAANKNLFADAWMNLLGAELMIERMYSERLNSYTTIGKKQAEELRDHFELQFEDSLKDTVKGIQLDDDDCCFSCETGGIEQVKSVM